MRFDRALGLVVEAALDKLDQALGRRTHASPSVADVRTSFGSEPRRSAIADEKPPVITGRSA